MIAAFHSNISECIIEVYLNKLKLFNCYPPIVATIFNFIIYILCSCVNRHISCTLERALHWHARAMPIQGLNSFEGYTHTRIALITDLWLYSYVELGSISVF